MSHTYHLACATCQEYVWIGQGWPGREPDTRVLYYGDERVMEALRRFLYAHESPQEHVADHLIFFASRESGLLENMTRWPE